MAVASAIATLSLMYKMPFAVSTGIGSLDGLLVLLTALVTLFLIFSKPDDHARRAKEGSGQEARGRSDHDIARHSDAALMRAVMDSVDEPIVVTQADHDAPDGPTIVFANRAYAKLAGCDADELVGRPATLLGSQAVDDTLRLAFGTTLEQGKSLRTEVLFYSSDHQQNWIDLNICPLRSTDGAVSHYAAFGRDIDSQKAVEARILSEKKHAEDANRLKSEFLATMSHEIRTPLNGIIGMSNLLADSKLDAVQREHVAMLGTSADTLLQLLNDILDLSKIEADRLELEIVTFDLKDMIFGLVDMIKPQLDNKDLEIVIDIEPDLPTKLASDPGRIRQIVLNLLSNAIKFTDKGHIRLYVTGIAAPAPGNQPLIEISVEDTGVGIAKAAQTKIFDKFRQQDASTTRRYGGTGLGLAICKELSQLLGGGMRLVSDEGVGSCFTFSFAYKPITSRTIHQRLKRNIKELGDLSGKRIVMIDDLAASGDSCGRILRAVGAEIRAFHQLERLGRDLSRWHTQYGMPDLIILDESLMTDSTAEILRKLTHVLGQSLPPILMLATTPVQGRHGILRQLGFGGVIPKPVRPSHLVRATAELILDYSADSFWTPHPELGNGPDKTTGDDQRRPLEGLQVLLAEDNTINAQIFVHMMERWGARVTVAGNGQEAIEIACSMNFDIIFMDCQMPELDGYEATRELRQLMTNGALKSVPIIALTANAMKGDRETCLAAGMDDYLSKPAQARDIAAMIRRWVTHQKQTEPATGETEATPPRQPATTLPGAGTMILIDQALYNECADILGPSHGAVIIDFIERLAAMLNQLAFAINQGQYQQTAKLVHPFKSSAAQLGAVAVSKLCRRIELKTRDIPAEDVDAEELTDLLITLREIAEQTSTKLATMIDDHPQPLIRDLAG